MHLTIIIFKECLADSLTTSRTTAVTPQPSPRIADKTSFLAAKAVTRDEYISLGAPALTSATLGNRPI